MILLRRCSALLPNKKCLFLAGFTWLPPASLRSKLDASYLDALIMPYKHMSKSAIKIYINVYKNKENHTGVQILKPVGPKCSHLTLIVLSPSSKGTKCGHQLLLFTRLLINLFWSEYDYIRQFK